MQPNPQLQIFGIRHHGPGSARSLRKALEALQPDIILVEGPPDAEEVIPLLAHATMEPPVALLVYAPDQPSKAVFYPFAVFSPEWQALSYGLQQAVPVRFMDLPQAHRLALLDQFVSENGHPAEQETEAADADQPPTPETQVPDDQAVESADEEATPESVDPRLDPLGALAEIAGFSDGERWWNYMVEQRQDGSDLFAGILEAMTALREELPPPADPIEVLREAYMRKTIRAAQKEGFTRIAVVCGAWHAPVLADMPPVKEDNAVLKGLPKIKTQATWVPWTYDRLSYHGGYGAGIESPGWYHHLWTAPDQIATRWLAGVARLLRDEDLDASSAHVIEAVRLAETLAALREHPLPGLPELNEATQTVICGGSDVPLRLIQRKLIVGERMGAVPTETPTVPLQQDLQREQRRLKMKVDDTVRTLDLDLRKENQLAQSHLLHRLQLLGIEWGEQQRVSSRKKGTFHELWQIQWQPEFAINIIEASLWGNTVYDAATGYAQRQADQAADLPTLTGLIEQTLLADLPTAVEYLMQRIQAEAAVSSDISHLMGALPPLANVLRYSDVRRTDTSAVSQVVDGLVVRACIGLPLACAALNDDAATAMVDQIISCNRAVVLLQNTDHTNRWQTTIANLIELPGVHGLIAGRGCRLLFDGHQLSGEETARRMGLALSTASEPPQAAAWLEGFLRDSGVVLLHDDSLLQVLDEWVTELRGEAFQALLPLLRRTFSTFEPPLRRQLGERLRRGLTARQEAALPIDNERAAQVLPLVAQLLGLQAEIGTTVAEEAER